MSKISKFVFIFYNIRSFLDSKFLLLVYYTHVHPNVIYNITVSVVQQLHDRIDQMFLWIKLLEQLNLPAVEHLQLSCTLG